MIYPIINIVNGCVLFPHMADWGQKPAHRRIWETNIAEGLKGNEARASMRAVPRRSLDFFVTSQSLEERVRLEARMDWASENGFACAPLHGRASTLMNAVAAGSRVNILLNTGGGWYWKVGDYAMLLQDDCTYDIAAVVNVGLTADGTWTADSELPVDQPALSLATPLNFAWNAGMQVRPVIFGRYTGPRSLALNGHLTGTKITITELVSGRSQQIGANPAAVPGIGQQVIGRTNVIP